MKNLNFGYEMFNSIQKQIKMGLEAEITELESEWNSIIEVGAEKKKNCSHFMNIFVIIMKIVC